jgi:hypothetical protein
MLKMQPKTLSSNGLHRIQKIHFIVREKIKHVLIWGLYNWPHTNLGCWNVQISTLKYQ